MGRSWEKGVCVLVGGPPWRGGEWAGVSPPEQDVQALSSGLDSGVRVQLMLTVMNLCSSLQAGCVPCAYP